MNLVNVSQRLEITFWKVLISLLEGKKTIRYLAILISLLILSVLLVRVTTGFLGLLETSDVARSHQLFSRGTLPSDLLDRQQNTLVILVDRLENPKPHLEGVWLAVYLPAMTNLTWLPLYPASLSGGAVDDDHLSGLFRLGAEGAPDTKFLFALNMKDLYWDNYVMLDKTALAEVIELSGGVDLGQGEIDGTLAVLSLPGAHEKPGAALIGQSMLVRGVCKKSAAFLRKTDAVQLFKRLSGHLRSDIALERMEEEWLRLRSGAGAIACEFPTFPAQAFSQSQP